VENNLECLMKENEITLNVGKQMQGITTSSVFSMKTIPSFVDSCQLISSNILGFWPTVVWVSM
jgi:hypothetical protein